MYGPEGFSVSKPRETRDCRAGSVGKGVAHS